MGHASRDDNYVPTLIGVSYVDLETPEKIAVDPANNRMMVSAIVTGSGATTERYDYDVATTIYTATAPIGTADDSTGWTITKYDLTDTNDASGKVATDVSWTNRATGTYQ